MKITSCSYINMDHRIDKKVNMLIQLNKCPLYIPIFRFSGLNIDNYTDYPVHNYIQTGSQMHKGVIGCWFAHKNLIKNFLDDYNNEGWTLILEDDVIIDPSFWPYLESLCPIDDSDMIFFDTCNVLIDEKFIIDKTLNIYNIYTSFPVFVGTHCYAIRNSSLNKVYNILDGVTTFKDIDGYYFGNNEIIKYNYQSGLIKINYKFQSDRLTPL
jgi:GR25 family glycosyltransferase involved in LPS biosynthesis